MSSSVPPELSTCHQPEVRCGKSRAAVINLHRLGAFKQRKLIVLWLVLEIRSRATFPFSGFLLASWPVWVSVLSPFLLSFSPSCSLSIRCSPLCVSISLSFYRISPRALSLCVFLCPSVPLFLHARHCVSITVCLSLCRLSTRSPPLHRHACFCVSPPGQVHPAPPAWAGAGGARWTDFEDSQGNLVSTGPLRFPFNTDRVQGLGAGQRGLVVALSTLAGVA